MTSPNACPALLLNADFRPIYPMKLLGWQEAVKAVLADRVSVVEEYETVVRSPGSADRGRFEMRLPSVLALRDYQRQDRPLAFTRIGVFLRDRFTCGYCERRFPIRGLTFDHLVPQSKGGLTRWSNIVTACERCNSQKGNLTPEAAGLILRRPPFVPTRWQLAELALEFPQSPRKVHSTWRAYLGMSEAAVVEEVARIGEAPPGVFGAFPADMTSEDYCNAEIDEI